MNIDISYDNDFTELMIHLKAKYGKELFKIDGIGESQLDVNNFSKDFFSTKNTTDVSVDGNSNVSTKDVIVYNKEMPKPLFRLNAYFLIWKKIKQLYGASDANRIVEMQLCGDIYINDFHGVSSSYCYNFSTYDIALEGLTMVNKIKSYPPKHLYAFKSQLEQFILIASNSVLGASGTADAFIVMGYYVNKILETKSDAGFKFASEEDCWNYVRETIISFIYTINQPMRSDQSPFTNISIFDDNFLDKLIPDYNFVDGKTTKETVKKIQELFLDIMNNELLRTPITFPVTSACFSVNDNKEIMDKEFLDMIAEKNLPFGFINLYSGKTTTLSSCCFHGSQQTLTRSSDSINYMSFEDLYNSNYEKYRRNFTIFHNGSWVKGKVVKIKKENKKLYKVITHNNKNIIVTDDHLNPCISGDRFTLDLSTNDYLLFNTMSLNKLNEKNMNLTYEQGVLIGAYLGDGSADKTRIQLSLNEEKIKILKPNIEKALSDFNIYKSIVEYTPYNNVYPIAINSKKLIEKIKYWVKGNYSYEKELNLEFLTQNKAFRKGILDGYYITDGGNSNRIYSTSEKLIYNIETLLTSLGYVSIIDESDRRDEKVVIRDKEYNRNYILYCIRYYVENNRRGMKDIYIKRNNNIYFKIKSIEEFKTEDEYVYCFEMANENEPYFTLPNGIITHNCRLRSNMEEVNNLYFNTLGGSSTKIGSLGVVTTNLPRLAYKYKHDKELFFNKLETLVEDVAKINNAKRSLIKNKIKKDVMPLYTLNFIDLNKQYSTFGLNGINEMVEEFGYDILKQDGIDFVLETMKVINDTNDKMQKKYKAPHNTEQVPAENSAIKLVKKDVACGYEPTVKFYSNQFIPLTTKADMLDRIKLQGIFDEHFSGGSILHLNVDERITDKQFMKDIIELCAEKGVIYFALNYNLQACRHSHMSVGRNETCQICGEPITDNYIRVVG